MSKFGGSNSKKDVPGISSGSLSDIVFMLLFFFMVTTQLRETENKVIVELPEATEVVKLERQDLSAQTGTDECLICRLLCQQFFPPVTPAFIAPSSVRLVNTGCFSDDIPLRFNHPFSTRAPPVSFCCPFPASTV